MLTCVVLCYLVCCVFLSYLVFPCVVLHCLSSWCLVLPCVMFCCIALSCHVLPVFAVLCVVSLCLVLTLPCVIVPCKVLSCLIFPCVVSRCLVFVLFLIYLSLLLFKDNETLSICSSVVMLSMCLMACCKDTRQGGQKNKCCLGVDHVIIHFVLVLIYLQSYEAVVCSHPFGPDGKMRSKTR